MGVDHNHSKYIYFIHDNRLQPSGVHDLVIADIKEYFMVHCIVHVNSLYLGLMIFLLCVDFVAIIEPAGYWNRLMGHLKLSWI